MTVRRTSAVYSSNDLTLLRSVLLLLVLTSATRITCGLKGHCLFGGMSYGLSIVK